MQRTSPNLPGIAKGLILAICLILASGIGKAETLPEGQQRFSFAVENTAIESLLEHIEKNSGFVFLYRKDILDTQKKVSLKVEDASIEEILDKALAGTKVSYKIDGKQITLSEKVATAQTSPARTLDSDLLDVRGVVLDRKSVV